VEEKKKFFNTENRAKGGSGRKRPREVSKKGKRKREIGRNLRMGGRREKQSLGFHAFKRRGGKGMVIANCSKVDQKRGKGDKVWPLAGEKEKELFSIFESKRGGGKGGVAQQLLEKKTHSKVLIGKGGEKRDERTCGLRGGKKKENNAECVTRWERKRESSNVSQTG